MQTGSCATGTPLACRFVLRSATPNVDRSLVLGCDRREAHVIERSRLLADDPFVGSDGQPMGETTRHVDQIVSLIQSLRELLRQRAVPGEYANGNQLFYWDPADAGKHVSPDVYVLRDAPARSPRCWKLWEMPSPPVFVAEIASRGTWREDLGRKKRLYRDVFRVQEYLVFDPEEALRDHGPLVAFRRVGDAYQRLPRHGAPGYAADAASHTPVEDPSE